MALDQYHHGVRVAEINDDTSLIRTFSAANGKASTKGTPSRSRPIKAQTRPIVVVVRIKEGDSEVQTTANATVNDLGKRTDAQALPSASASLGIIQLA